MTEPNVRAIKIDVDGEASIVQISPRNCFDGSPIDMVTFDDANDIVVDDEGLFQLFLVTATIGNLRRLPLPAYIVGADGEEAVDTKLDVEDVRKAVGDITVVRGLIGGFITK
jgi:hypothetical protein